MSALTKEGHTVVMDKDGQPAFVVIPYGDYRGLVNVSGDDATIPHEIMDLHIVKGFTLIKAWRKHLKLTQSDVAERMGISQAGFAQIEANENTRKETKDQVAKALGIAPECLDIE